MKIDRLSWASLVDWLGPGTQVWHAKGFGVIVRRKKEYWISNDTRWKLIGHVPNSELCQPTLGPFKSRKEALTAYEAATSGTAS
jgi:hypothetical protein